MSLILEALRKSEAERRRGQAPGLFVEQIPVMASRRKRAPAWTWWLGALLLVVLAVLAWREFGRGLPDAVEPAVVTAPDPVETTVPAAADNPPSPDYPATAIPNDPVVSAPPVSPPPVAATPIAPPVVEQTPPAPAPPVETSPVIVAAPAAPTTSAPPVTEPAIATTASDPLVAQDEAVPRLASLPASDRAQLPPLKLSMHVYAEDPAQRFVILDGKRLQEGASPAAGVVLEQIRRDGLVLSVNGRRVLLARP